MSDQNFPFICSNIRAAPEYGVYIYIYISQLIRYSRLTVMEYLCHKWRQKCSTCRSFPHLWLITGFITRLTQWMPLVVQELLTLPEDLRSSPVLVWPVRVTRSLVLCVCFVDRCLSFCPFSFYHCVACFSSIYRFWLPIWYLQTLLTKTRTGGLYLIEIV
jgi:hypothetical protein